MSTTIADVRFVTRLLAYCPETGVLTWRVSPNNKVRAGQPAGTDSNGYVSISLNGRRHGAHQLAWLIHYGEWPKHGIDHIDGDKKNNRITNLRDVPQTVNMLNLRRAHADSRTGLLGVTQHKKRWKAQIGINGRQVHIGTYDTPEQAHQAYLAAKALETMLKRVL